MCARRPGHKKYFFQGTAERFVKETSLSLSELEMLNKPLKTERMQNRKLEISIWVKKWRVSFLGTKKT